MKNKPVILVIMDGFGITAMDSGNSVLHAKTPNFDKIISNYPTALLSASGQEVGLEFGEIGNSEVGHLNIGTGRVIMQDLPRINLSIEDKSFFANKELIDACCHVNKNKSRLHLVGLTSDGGVHSHLDHLLALIDFAKNQKIKNVYIHMITDGRDTSPKVAKNYIKKINDKISKCGVGKIATICGRFYAMDRDNHWEDRTKLAYDLWTNGIGENIDNAESAIDASYKAGENDENIKPKMIEKEGTVKDKDALIFYNYRIDRTRQITESLIDPNFKNFKRNNYLKNMMFVMFTNYGFEPTRMVKIAFFARNIELPLGEIISKSKLSQFHIAETEKYAHVTYFFNGGKEKPYASEERILVPSPRIESYDKKPEMSAKEVTKKLLTFYNNKKPDFIVVNFANPDMVGHTGNYNATVKAVETVDSCIGEIIKIAEKGEANAIITADHGNCEQMINPETSEEYKEHTTNAVPFTIISDKKQDTGFSKEALGGLQPVAVLADIAPTVIDFLEIKKPNKMNGQSLRNII